MSETVLTSPIILDATGQDMLTKLDSIISAINPVAQGVSYDNAGTGMVANNVQSAITELKTGLVNTNSSLTQKQDTIQFSTWTPTASDYPSSANTSALSFIRWGNVCTLVGVLRVTSASTSITLLSNIAHEFLPKYVNTYISAQWYGDNSGCDIKIDLNGALTCAIPSGSVNKDIKVMGAWICNG